MFYFRKKKKFSFLNLQICLRIYLGSNPLYTLCYSLAVSVSIALPFTRTALFRWSSGKMHKNIFTLKASFRPSLNLLM